MLNHKKYLVTMILTIIYSNSQAGRFEMIHSAVKQPGLENCTPYRDLLGNEFEYSVNDISGPIPYTHNYQTALSENLNRNREITDGLKTIGGWQDNFNHYLILFDEGNTSSGDLRILLRLRFLNEHDETFYIGGLGADQKLGKISRIFSSMPLYYEGYLAKTGNGQREDADRIGYHSENHRDKGLVLNQPSAVFSDGKSVNNVKNLSFTLYKDGNKYTLSHISTFGSDAIYKITAAELSTGQNLKFKYNASDAGLVKVVDQYGNFLTIERNKKDPDTAYAPISYPTKVIAGKYASKSNTIDDYLNRTPTEAELADAKVQQAQYSYEEFDWTNHLNGNKEKIYAISAVNSTNNPTEKYSYTKVGNINITRDPPFPSGSEFFVPVLTRAYHSKYRDFGGDLTSDIANFDYKKDTNLWFSYPFSSSKAGITRANVVKTRGHENAYQTFYSLRTMNFISTDNTADKDFDPMTIYIDGDHRKKDMYIDFGGYPCVTYNNTPIQRAGFDVLTSDLKYVIDRNGNATAFQYDDFGRLSTLIEAERDEALKRTTTYTYSPDVKRFQTPLKIERKDETVVNTLDSKGRVTSSTVTNTNGGVTKSKKSTYQYENDLLKSQTDPDGSIKTFEYEDIGVNKKKETITKDGLSSVTEFSNYNSAGAPSKIIEPSGVIQDISYNQSNLPTVKARTDSASGLVQANNYSYDFKNDVIREIQPEGKIKNYRYNSVTNLLQGVIEKDKYLKTNYSYNSNGQIISEKEQYGEYVLESMPDNVGELRDKASYVYDRLGNLTESKYGSDGMANWQKKEYDANGNVLKIIEPNAEGTESVESFTYDGLNRKKTYTDPLGKIYSYNYDSFDNATLKKASNGSNSTNSYTSGKDLAKETNSDYGVKEYTYDGVSNLLTAKHASIRYCNYLSYDVLDNYKQSNCQHVNQTASSKDVNYKYNYHSSRFGRLDKVESQNKTGFTDGQRYWGGNTEYSYDGLDRVIAKQQRAGRLQAADKKLTVNYGYTQGDRIKEITYPSGEKVNYNYTYYELPYPLGGIVGDTRLQGISLGDQNILTLGYNDINLVSSMKWGNGNTTDYVYDSVKNITNITNKVNNADYDSIVNSYYKNGLLQTKKIGSQTRTYKYDKKGQLLQELLTGGYTHTFSYDDNGNRKTFSSSGTGSPYPITSASYTYSTSGNKYATMTHNNAAQSFSYNATGELNLPNILGTAVYDYQGRRATEGATPDGKYTSHEIDYNHKNQRILTARNESTRQYVYDEADHLLGEYDGNGQALVEYIWLGDKPVSAIYGDKIVYLLTDEKNTPYRGIDSATNNKVWVRNSDAFGVAKPTVETVEMNLRFPGQVYDKATGLHYNLNRYYNPLLGRYMEADPIGLEGGWNPYAYAMNDPVNKVDPKGLLSVSGDFYIGYGGGFDVSYKNGSLEVIGRVGVGFGAGLSFDPIGEPSVHTKPTGSGFIGRTSVKADVGLGVGNVGVSLVGVNAKTGNGFVQKEGGGTFEATTPTINLNPFAKDQHFKTGVSAAGAISADLGGYTNLKMPKQNVQPKLEKKMAK